MPDRSRRSHMIWQPGDAVVARARALTQVAQRNAAFLVKCNTGLHVRQQLICFLCVLHLCRCDISQMCEWHTTSSLELLQYQHHQCYWPEYGWKGEYDWAERLFNWISTPIIFFWTFLVSPLRPYFLERLTIRHASRQKASGTQAALMPHPCASGSCQILQHSTRVKPRNHPMLQVTKHFNEDKSSGNMSAGASIMIGG